MPKKQAPAKKPERNRVWIEFETPTDDEHALRICAAANRMFTRLCSDVPRPARELEWNKTGQKFEMVGPMGASTLVDSGDWFNLDYFGRP